MKKDLSCEMRMIGNAFNLNYFTKVRTIGKHCVHATSMGQV